MFLVNFKLTSTQTLICPFHLLLKHQIHMENHAEIPSPPLPSPPLPSPPLPSPPLPSPPLPSPPLPSPPLPSPLLPSPPLPSPPLPSPPLPSPPLPSPHLSFAAASKVSLTNSAGDTSAPGGRYYRYWCWRRSVLICMLDAAVMK